ncbi:uncharacterized protein LOC144333270 [Macaca mulatta]
MNLKIRSTLNNKLDERATIQVNISSEQTSIKANSRRLTAHPYSSSESVQGGSREVRCRGWKDSVPDPLAVGPSAAVQPRRGPGVLNLVLDHRRRVKCTTNIVNSKMVKLWISAPTVSSAASSFLTELTWGW